MRFSCHCLDHPLLFDVREGATPETTLNGLLGEILLTRCCPFGEEAAHRCLERRRLDCPDFPCALSGVYKPSPFPRPIRLRFIPESDSTAFGLDVVLWGRRALALRPSLAVLVHFMGETGLRLGQGRSTRFEVSRPDLVFDGTLEQWAARLFPEPSRMDRLLVEFVTPFAHEEKIQDPDRGLVKAAMASGPFPLAKTLGNTANNLVLWRAQDQEPVHTPLTSELKNAAQAAREMVEDLCSPDNILIENNLLVPHQVGTRASRKTGAFQMDGFLGYTVLTGRLEPLLPWLSVWPAFGGGAKISFGFGQVRLWSGLGVSLGN